MLVRRLIASSIILGALIATACSTGDDGSIPPEVERFCNDLMTSPAFACCPDGDRKEPLFATRAYYASADDCKNQLGRALGESQSRRIFDQAAADGCLGLLKGRSCTLAVTATAREAAAKAGCERVIVGTQGVGAPCDVSADCKPGLLCPPVRQTGASTCVEPALANQSCVGDGATFDHAPCKPGLFCQAVDQTFDCADPPCTIFQCANLGEDGEGCTGLDCREGLDCRDGLCHPAQPPSGPGSPCRIAENCAEGLFCDTAIGSCQARKANGAPCRNPATANAILECRGVCRGPVDGTGVCAAFCSAG